MIGPLPLTLLLLAATSCTGVEWLMEGDFIPAQEATARHLHLENANSTTSVTSSLLLSLGAPPGHRINCILAAALHLNGDVRLLEGGVGSPTVTLAYETREHKADQFFVLIESHAREPLQVHDGVASKISILYDGLKSWIKNDIPGDQLANSSEGDTEKRIKRD